MPAYRLAQLLSFAGAIPIFIALLIEIDDDPIFGLRGSMYAHSYGVLILSFIAGIHWGVYLFFQGKLNLFAVSNVLALVAWASLFTFGSHVGLSILILCFAVALAVDAQCRHDDIIPAWFWRLRMQITAVVITLLFLTAIAI